jgi:hypothetical protein
MPYVQFALSVWHRAALGVSAPDEDPEKSTVNTRRQPAGNLSRTQRKVQLTPVRELILTKPYTPTTLIHLAACVAKLCVCLWCFDNVTRVSNQQCYTDQQDSGQ